MTNSNIGPGQLEGNPPEGQVARPSSSESLGNHIANREELINTGMNARQVDIVMVQRHQHEVLATYFRRWLIFFRITLCVVVSACLGLLTWHAVAWNSARNHTERCDRPLIEWGSALYVFKMYYFFLHQWFLKCLCNYNRNQEPRPPMPARVFFYNMLLAFADFSWNMAGIILAGTSEDCDEELPGLYKSTLSFASVSMFLTLFMTFHTIGVHSLLAYMMMNCMLKTNAAAPSGTLEAQKVVPFGSQSLHEIESCSICLEDWSADEEIRQTACNHVFHAKCLKGWLNINHNCPMCRQDLREEGENIGQDVVEIFVQSASETVEQRGQEVVMQAVN